MSPILVRPVREQLEHDRIIRLLQAKNRRQYRGRDQSRRRAERRRSAAAPAAVYPGSRAAVARARPRLQAVVEVETGESVNHLEALAQWAHFAKLRAAVPPLRAVRHGRRRAAAVRGQPDSTSTKSGAIHAIGDEVRFTLVHRSREAAPPPARRVAPAPAAPQDRCRRPKAGAPTRPAAQHGKPAPAQSRRRSRAARAETKVARALRQVLARQARLRTHLPGPRVAPARQAGRPRVLYWFRTPPGVKVGREPFDEEVQRDARGAESRRRLRLDAARRARPMPPPDVGALARAAARRARRAGARGHAEDAGRGRPKRRSTWQSRPRQRRRARTRCRGRGELPMSSDDRCRAPSGGSTVGRATPAGEGTARTAVAAGVGGRRPSSAGAGAADGRPPSSESAAPEADAGSPRARTGPSDPSRPTRRKAVATKSNRPRPARGIISLL